MSDLAAFLTRTNQRQSDFAKRIGVDQATVSRLARRTHKPSLELAIRIERETDGQVPAVCWVEESENGGSLT